MASMMSSMVIILVTLAGARGSWAFFSYSTVPVATSMSTALLTGTSKVSPDAPNTMAGRSADSISAAMIRFIEHPPPLSWKSICP